MGVLLEGGKYKDNVRGGNLWGLMGDVLGGRGAAGEEENPLKRGKRLQKVQETGEGSYQKMNKESGMIPPSCQSVQLYTHPRVCLNSSNSPPDPPLLAQLIPIIIPHYHYHLCLSHQTLRLHLC